jgi:hypothetical protein
LAAAIASSTPSTNVNGAVSAYSIRRPRRLEYRGPSTAAFAAGRGCGPLVLC